MTFIRLAGCTVGKRYPATIYEKNMLPVYTEQCTLYDGRKFPCDTDYRMKLGRQSVEALVTQVPKGVSHVCITGGEPLMHDLVPLFNSLTESGYWIHLETSGTKLMPDISNSVKDRLWITVSPKSGYLDAMIDRASELKVLVDEDFVWSSLPKRITGHPRLYIQPVNFEHGIKNENVVKCLQIQRQHPNVRLSLQLHKVLSDYAKERIQ